MDLKKLGMISLSLVEWAIRCNGVRLVTRRFIDLKR